MMVLRRFLPNLKSLGQLGISETVFKKIFEINYLKPVKAVYSLSQTIFLKTVFEIPNLPSDFKFGKYLLRIII